jgi:hypothetical protein
MEEKHSVDKGVPRTLLAGQKGGLLIEVKNSVKRLRYTTQDVLSCQEKNSLL